MINKVLRLISKVSADIFFVEFKFNVDLDKICGKRIYIQVSYGAPCTDDKIVKEWKGRKWYLSDYMSDDEIIKTAYLAFETAVKHEILEAFKVNGKKLFNPHTPYTKLLEASTIEETRTTI